VRFRASLWEGGVVGNCRRGRAYALRIGLADNRQLGEGEPGPFRPWRSTWTPWVDWRTLSPGTWGPLISRNARRCLAEFRQRYNERRPHWALVREGGGDPVTPHDVYVGGVQVGIPKWQGWAKGAKAKLDQMMAA